MILQLQQKLNIILVYRITGKDFVLSLHYNGSNSFFFVNAIKIHQFNAKDLKAKPYTLCAGIISKVKVLSIKLNHYIGKTKRIYFFIKDDNLLNKHSTIWDKISVDVKVELNSEPVYNKKMLKTKPKFYGNQTIYFHSDEVPKVNSSYTCLVVISLNFTFVDEKYYQQVFFRECKYIKKSA